MGDEHEDEYGASVRLVMRRACTAGDLDAVQAAAARLGVAGSRDWFGQQSARGYLVDACWHGHLAVAQWLAAKLCLTPTDARADGVNSALICACVAGHSAVVAWLASHFGLDRADAQSNNNQALRGACANGRLETAQLMAATFKLRLEDVRANDHECLCKACENGHLAVAQWLVTGFGIDAAEVRRHQAVCGRDLRQSALWAACAVGHLAIISWLVRAYGLSADYIRAMRGGSLLNTACGAGHLAVVQYYVREAGLAAPDDLARAAISADSHPDVAGWLRTQQSPESREREQQLRAVPARRAARYSLFAGPCDAF